MADEEAELCSRTYPNPSRELDPEEIAECKRLHKTKFRDQCLDAYEACLWSLGPTFIFPQFNCFRCPRTKKDPIASCRKSGLDLPETRTIVMASQ